MSLQQNNQPVKSKKKTKHVSLRLPIYACEIIARIAASRGATWAATAQDLLSDAAVIKGMSDQDL